MSRKLLSILGVLAGNSPTCDALVLKGTQGMLFSFGKTDACKCELIVPEYLPCARGWQEGLKSRDLVLSVLHGGSPHCRAPEQAGSSFCHHAPASYALPCLCPPITAPHTCTPTSRRDPRCPVNRNRRDDRKPWAVLPSLQS